ncbi:MAG: MFS transporter, partial [Mycobacterium leprae]
MDTIQGRRNLWFYAAANAVSRFGGQYQFLAVTALTYAVTGSPLFTAMQMAVSGLPMILLARWTGLPADRFDPRRVITVVSLVQAVLTLGYLLSGSVVWILVLNLLVATASAFAGPARATLVPQMVGHDQIMRANARLATVGGAVELVSPVLAGFMLVRTSTAAAFLFNAASFLFPAAAMLLVQLVEPLERKNRAAAEGSALHAAWLFLQARRGMMRLLLGYGA